MPSLSAATWAQMYDEETADLPPRKSIPLSWDRRSILELAARLLPAVPLTVVAVLFTRFIGATAIDVAPAAAHSWVGPLAYGVPAVIAVVFICRLSWLGCQAWAASQRTTKFKDLYQGDVDAAMERLHRRVEAAEDAEASDAAVQRQTSALSAGRNTPLDVFLRTAVREQSRIPEVASISLRSRWGSVAVMAAGHIVVAIVLGVMAAAAGMLIFDVISVASGAATSAFGDSDAAIAAGPLSAMFWLRLITVVAVGVATVVVYATSRIMRSADELREVAHYERYRYALDDVWKRARQAEIAAREDSGLT